MVNFEEMFDGIVSKTKDAAKVAGQKTSELVEMGKLKYQEQSISRDITKAYARLGAIVYEAKENGEQLDGLIEMTLDEIRGLNEKLDTVEKNMASTVDSFRKPVVKEETAKDVEPGITVPWGDGSENPAPASEENSLAAKEKNMDAISLEVDETVDELNKTLDERSDYRD